jgi:hypothetical protein
MDIDLPNATHDRPRPRQAQPVPAVSGMGCGLCGSSRSRMPFSARVWGDSDRGSKSTSRRSAVIRTARSLSERSSRCITSNMARKPSGGKAGPLAHARRGDAWPRSRTSLNAAISRPIEACDDPWGPGGYLVEPAWLEWAVATITMPRYLLFEDASSVADFIEYLVTLFSSWLIVMGAGPFLVDRLIGWFSRPTRKWLDEHPRRNQIYRWIIVIGIFIAGFSAWQAEHQKAAKAETELAKRASAENRRKQDLRSALRQFYVEATDRINESTHLPSDISAADLSQHIDKQVKWMKSIYRWAKENLGDAAADTLTEGQQTMGYSAAHGKQELNNLLNSLFPFRDDIRKLIETNMWDAAHADSSHP